MTCYAARIHWPEKSASASFCSASKFCPVANSRWGWNCDSETCCISQHCLGLRRDLCEWWGGVGTRRRAGTMADGRGAPLSWSYGSNRIQLEAEMLLLEQVMIAVRDDRIRGDHSISSFSDRVPTFPLTGRLFIGATLQATGALTSSSQAIPPFASMLCGTRRHPAYFCCCWRVKSVDCQYGANQPARPASLDQQTP
jgi:hypothetical protein